MKNQESEVTRSERRRLALRRDPLFFRAGLVEGLAFNSGLSRAASNVGSRRSFVSRFLISPRRWSPNGDDPPPRAPRFYALAA
ncbi:hypothetical protein MPC4_240053 [Methylocella tundrae]|uniref:Uncharacterized protein n=1 Tax=Methylocella tundrae TaxID=227605 RepID=A0A8B6M8V5_METTU|nr:hypothetical protein MPC4_240053 [Methylocella tundrae]